MDLDDVSPVERRVRSLEDRALQRLVALERDDWTEEALGVARDELARRGLTALDRDDYLAEHPEETVTGDGLCESCAREGLDITRCHPALMIFLGVRMIPTGLPCEVCRSRVVRMWWPLLPLVPLGTYRMLGS